MVIWRWPGENCDILHVALVTEEEKRYGEDNDTEIKMA
jgi:hypothetical protein